MYQTKERQGQQCAEAWLFTTQWSSLLWSDPLGNTNKRKTGHLHSAQHHPAQRGAAVPRAELSDYASPSQGTVWDNEYIKRPILLLLFYSIKSYCARLFQEYMANKKIWFRFRAGGICMVLWFKPLSVSIAVPDYQTFLMSRSHFWNCWIRKQ